MGYGRLAAYFKVRIPEEAGDAGEIFTTLPGC